MPPVKAPVVQGFSTSLSLEEVTQQLNSRDFSENMDGLRNLVGLMSHGVEVDAALPHVIKLVIHPDLSARRCVYQFLSHFSESNPAQALMAVNILQRALSDKNSLVRGMALRALSSIRVREIAEVARMSLEQHVIDESPFVRRIAAIGVAKLYSFCPEFKQDLRSLLERCLGDGNALVFGAALQAFELAFPEDWDLFHSHFHKLCSSLPEMDSYQQVNALQLMTRYVRANFSDARYKTDEELPNDLQVAYKAAGMLLRTNSPAVVLEASSFLFHCSPAFERQFEINLVARSVAHAVTVSLVRVLSAQFTTAQLPILAGIRLICERYPQFFAPHFREFYLRGTEPGAEKVVKMQILCSLAGILSDVEQDQLLTELKSYVTYAICSLYVEQQEINMLVLKAVSKIVEAKAAAMLSQGAARLDEFRDSYYQALFAPIQRALDGRRDAGFANDAVFQQAMIEVCQILRRIAEIDRAVSTCAQEQVSDVLIGTGQIYLDIVQDEKQDKRYPIPKAVWPGYVGFEQKFDPLVFQEEIGYNTTLNRKSIVQVTRLGLFIQEQLRRIFVALSLLSQASQGYQCVRTRASVIRAAADLRFYAPAFIPDLMRTSLVRIADEPFEVKLATWELFQVVMADIDIFRAAVVYWKQRRLIQDAAKSAEEKETDAFKQRYQGVEATQLSPEQVAEEQSNVDYAIRQMQEHFVKTLQLDHSYLVRDLAALQQFAGYDDHVFALHTDFSEQQLILGTLSQVMCAKAETCRLLPPFSTQDSAPELRLVQYSTQAAYSSPKQQIAFASPSISSQAVSGQPDHRAPAIQSSDPGIVIRGRQDVDAFLGSPAQPQEPQQPEQEESDYYYSQEEPVQSAQPSQPTQPTQNRFPGRPQLNLAAGVKVAQVVSAKKSVQVAVQKVVTQPRPVAPAPAPQAQKGPQIMFQTQQSKTVQKAPQAAAPTPAAAPANDLLSLFGGAPSTQAPASAPVQQTKPASPTDGDLLSLLFQ